MQPASSPQPIVPPSRAKSRSAASQMRELPLPGSRAAAHVESTLSGLPVLDLPSGEVVPQWDETGLVAEADAALIQGAGIPTLSVGASGGNLHAPDEWVSLPELVAVARVLARTCEDYCGDRGSS